MKLVKKSAGRPLEALMSIGTASANSEESDHRCTKRIYFDNDNAGDSVTLMLYNVTLMSQKTC